MEVVRNGGVRAVLLAVLLAGAPPALRAQTAQAAAAMPNDSAAKFAADSAALVAGNYAVLLPVEGQFRVCADPNALPYSNSAEEGYENKLAQLIAREFKATAVFTWYPQRRGFVRNTLADFQCDVVMGVPSTVDMLLTTVPYYRSSYVFIYRKDRGLKVRSFDDPALKTLKIGVYQFGDDYNNTPPVHALVERGVDPNHLVGYSLYGDYAKPNPPADLIHAVANGEVDLAIGWGPIAGFFAGKETVPMEVVPVSPTIDLPFRPYVYDMSMGVRRENKLLKLALDEIITRHRSEIRQLLASYGVPLVERASTSASQPTAQR